MVVAKNQLNPKREGGREIERESERERKRERDIGDIESQLRKYLSLSVRRKGTC